MHVEEVLDILGQLKPLSVEGIIMTSSCRSISLVVILLVMLKAHRNYEHIQHITFTCMYHLCPPAQAGPSQPTSTSRPSWAQGSFPSTTS